MRFEPCQPQGCPPGWPRTGGARAKGIGQMREGGTDEGDSALNRAARFIQDHTAQKAAP